MEEKHIRFKPVESDPDAVYEKVWQRINHDRIVARSISPIWKYTAIAASIALLIVSSLFFLIPTNRETTSYIDIVATAGSKTHVVLPDGTSVWLNSNAAIRYPQKFTGKSREVAFKGEAYFDVKTDKEYPFIVKMDEMRVQVLGTSFNIHTGTASDIIEVTLNEGSVALFTQANNSAVADRLLSPGQQALYNKTNRVFEVRNVRSALYSSWVTGMFLFENNSLQEIMTTLERAFNTHIYIGDEALKNTHLTARFTHGETLDEILSILQAPAKYKYRKEEGRIYISLK